MNSLTEANPPYYLYNDAESKMWDEIVIAYPKMGWTDGTSAADAAVATAEQVITARRSKTDAETKFWDEVVLSCLKSNWGSADAAIANADQILTARRRTGR